MFVWERVERRRRRRTTSVQKREALERERENSQNKDTGKCIS